MCSLEFPLSSYTSWEGISFRMNELKSMEKWIIRHHQQNANNVSVIARTSTPFILKIFNSFRRRMRTKKKNYDLWFSLQPLHDKVNIRWACFLLACRDISLRLAFAAVVLPSFLEIISEIECNGALLSQFAVPANILTLSTSLIWRLSCWWSAHLLNFVVVGFRVRKNILCKVEHHSFNLLRTTIQFIHKLG